MHELESDLAEKFDMVVTLKSSIREEIIFFDGILLMSVANSSVQSRNHEPPLPPLELTKCAGGYANLVNMSSHTSMLP